jgi:hypothetical protein
LPCPEAREAQAVLADCHGTGMLERAGAHPAVVLIGQVLLRQAVGLGHGLGGGWPGVAKGYVGLPAAKLAGQLHIVAVALRGLQHFTHFDAG